MEQPVIPYDPYHPHLAYTLAVTGLAWVCVLSYNLWALRDWPRARAMLYGLLIVMPLFAELGSYIIFLVRPEPDTPVGRVLSHIHNTVIQRIPIDYFLSSTTLVVIVALLSFLLLISLLRFWYGSLQLRRVLQTATPLANTPFSELRGELVSLAHQQQVALPPIYVVAISEPLALATGLLSPRIYISTSLLASLADDEVLAVLCHEWAHIRRRDTQWNWLLRLLRDTAWFLPFSHIAWRRMMHSQDEACDAFAASVTRKPLALARALVKVSAAWSRSTPPNMTAATPFALHVSDIRTRVEHMLHLSHPAPVASQRALVGAFVLGGTFMVLAVLPALLGS